MSIISKSFLLEPSFHFQYPPLGYSVFMFAALLGLLAAVAKIFWLIVFGVDEEKFWAVEAAER